MTLGEKILSLRTARDMSQDDLAEKLEVSRQSVSKWETGQSTPDLDKIIKLADLFGVSVDELVRDVDAPQPQPEAEQRNWSGRGSAPGPRSHPSPRSSMWNGSKSKGCPPSRSWALLWRSQARRWPSSD